MIPISVRVIFALGESKYLKAIAAIIIANTTDPEIKPKTRMIFFLSGTTKRSKVLVVVSK
jgi:hypothetical protein